MVFSKLSRIHNLDANSRVADVSDFCNELECFPRVAVWIYDYAFAHRDVCLRSQGIEKQAISEGHYLPIY